jgi:predicted ATPase
MTASAAVSRQWLDGVELLCFDEFHVHDIADAFLIGRFLEIALELGTRIVLTSNSAPQGLLPNPEFHERFDLSRTLSRLAEMRSRAYLNPLDGVADSSEATTCPP